MISKNIVLEFPGTHFMHMKVKENINFLEENITFKKQEFLPSLRIFLILEQKKLWKAFSMKIAQK